MLKPISKQQSKILGVIEKQMSQRGFPPSIREIGEAVGLTSSSTVHSHLVALTQKGYIVRDPSKPRSITLASSGKLQPPHLSLLHRWTKVGKFDQELLKETLIYLESQGVQ